MSRVPPLLIVAGLAFTAGLATKPTPQSEWAVYFSPRGGATEAIVREIDGSRTTIKVQAYGFTSRPIAAALIEAHRRGVQVAVIVDDSNVGNDDSMADEVAAAGIKVWVDGRHAIAHNKVLVIDNLTVITGSFNLTRAAEESNAENLLVLRDRRLAAEYADNWRTHFQHCQRWRDR